MAKPLATCPRPDSSQGSARLAFWSFERFGVVRIAREAEVPGLYVGAIEIVHGEGQPDDQRGIARGFQQMVHLMSPVRLPNRAPVH